MTILAPPRHPLIDTALADAKRWCAGRVIDDRPALTHAARVAVMIGTHHPDASPELIAAALLHDSPEFAPPTTDLDAHLTAGYGAEVLRLVRGMQAEHDALDLGTPRIPDPADRALVLLSTADKVVALTSLLRRAGLSGDTLAFFSSRRPLLDLLAHFRACELAAAGAVPTTLTAALAQVLDDIAAVTSPLTR